jgi:uncharacterized protein YqiB (DUF1249 family)
MLNAALKKRNLNRMKNSSFLKLSLINNLITNIRPKINKITRFRIPSNRVRILRKRIGEVNAKKDTRKTKKSIKKSNTKILNPNLDLNLNKILKSDLKYHLLQWDTFQMQRYLLHN